MKAEEPRNQSRLNQCPYCGERLWAQDRFCPNCGSAAAKNAEHEVVNDWMPPAPSPVDSEEQAEKRRRFWPRRS
jgi:hypothetical protein